MMTPDEIREEFVSAFIRGDFINTQIHSQINLVRLLVESSSNEDLEQINPGALRFSQIYGDEGKKKWMVGMFIKSLRVRHEQQDIPDIKTLSELLRQHPDLQKDIDYADYLVEKFGNRLMDIIAELKNDHQANREAVLKKLDAEIASIQKLKEETKEFRCELDANYQKHQKEKAGETVRPQDGDRK